jgi:hypothetical protein
VKAAARREANRQAGVSTQLESKLMLAARQVKVQAITIQTICSIDESEC